MAEYRPEHAPSVLVLRDRQGRSGKVRRLRGKLIRLVAPIAQTGLGALPVARFGEFLA